MYLFSLVAYNNRQTDTLYIHLGIQFMHINIYTHIHTDNLHTQQ